VRSFLSAPGQTAGVLRQACHGLLERELTLRTEGSPEALAVLEKESGALRQKALATSDARVRASLESAVAAIEEQKRQRVQMVRHADRLDAELTRLLWTIDGMNAQLVRARAAGAELAAPDAAVAQSVQQLNQEIQAIASALETIADDDRGVFAEGAPTPISAPPPSESAHPAGSKTH
jgi:cell division protein FtsB